MASRLSVSLQPATSVAPCQVERKSLPAPVGVAGFLGFFQKLPNFFRLRPITNSARRIHGCEGTSEQAMDGLRVPLGGTCQRLGDGQDDSVV